MRKNYHAWLGCNFEGTNFHGGHMTRVYVADIGNGNVLTNSAFPVEWFFVHTVKTVYIFEVSDD